jgi:Kef-type K+ transport system membrane component KefB
MEAIFFEITILVSLTVVLAIIFRIFHQPPVLAYILTGVLVGPLAVFQIGNSQELLHLMGEFGITLLLFMLGLELRISDLKSVGKVVLMSGFSEIAISFLLAFGLTRLLGFPVTSAVYLALALSFSSTILIVKLLSDKKDLNSLYGKISVGILLVDDLVVTISLVVLSGFNGTSSFSVISLGMILVKIVLLFAVVIYLSIHILPKLTDYISKSQETLFLFSIAWAFGIAALVSSPFIGFSVEIGGFLAGLSLANTHENYQIISKIRPLRDFFVTIFFILIGTSMVFTHILAVIIPAIILSAFVLFIRPIIVMSILGFLGFRRRTSFFASLSLAQISELSLVLIFLAQKVGHVNSEIVTLVTLVAIITFAFSTSFIMHDNSIYHKIHRYLKIFEKKEKREQTGELGELKDHIVLIGGSRIGHIILDALKVKGTPFIVVDFNPDIIRDMEDNNILSLFGDIGDPEIQERAYLDTANLIITTIPDLKDNLVLLDALKKINRRAKIIAFARSSEEEKILYKEGADYVVVPHFSGGQHIAQIIQNNTIDSQKLLELKSMAHFH